MGRIRELWDRLRGPKKQFPYPGSGGDPTAPADRSGSFFGVPVSDRQQVEPSERILFRMEGRGARQALAPGEELVAQTVENAEKERLDVRPPTRVMRRLTAGSSIPPPADIGNKNFGPFVLSLPDRQEVVLGGVRSEPAGTIADEPESFLHLTEGPLAGKRRFKT